MLFLVLLPPPLLSGAFLSRRIKCNDKHFFARVFEEENVFYFREEEVLARRTTEKVGKVAYM